MNQSPQFRRGERVTVHWGNFRTSRGRVICHNRRNKYNLSVVVLIMTERNTEIVETFTPDGKRWASNDSCHLTHGWEDE